jgi:transcriptional regulator with XRE-family HTH domain
MVGSRLRELRLSQHLTYEALAEALGLSNGKEVWRYENEKVKPSGERVAEIAQFFNVSADYLLGISPDPAPLDDLSPDERAVISAMRRGQPMEAIKVIAGHN